MKMLLWLLGGMTAGFVFGLVALFPLFGDLLPNQANDGTGFLGVTVGTAAGGIAGYLIGRRRPSS